MDKRVAIGIILVFTALIGSACNRAFSEEQSEPQSEQPKAEQPSEESADDPGVEPTATSVEDTELPQGPPIAHFDPDTLILITNIQMITQERGWGIGGLDGNADHIFRTQDGGQTWKDVTPPEPAPGEEEPTKAAIGYFLDPTTGWVAYYEQSVEVRPIQLRVWGTSDGGESWVPSQAIDLEFLGNADYPPSMGFEDADNGWLVARHGPAGMHKYPVYVLRTADGGRNWKMAITPAEGALQSCRKSGIVFATPRLGWATLADCPVVAPEIAVTQDGGQNWEAIALPAPQSRPELFETELCESHSPQLITDLIGAVVVTCRTGLLLNYVYTTSDAGQTWDSYLYPGGELTLLSQQTAFAFDRHIHETLDGGQSWDFVKTVQWDGQFSFVSEEVGWAVARQGEALALVNTTNGGRTWNLLKPVVTS